MRFFKKIQDWILKSERIGFCVSLLNRSIQDLSDQGASSSSRVDSSVPLTPHDPRYLGLICLVKKRKIRFHILSDLRIQSWIFLKKRTLKIRGSEIFQPAPLSQSEVRKQCNEPIGMGNHSTVWSVRAVDLFKLQRFAGAKLNNFIVFVRIKRLSKEHILSLLN